MQDYKKARPEQQEKKVEKVISGNAKLSKKSGARKFADLFLPEDVSNVKSFVVTDIIVPAIKKIISDTVDMILYEGGSNRGRGSTPAGRVSYRSYYDSKSGSSRSSQEPARARSVYNYDEIILPTRGDAEVVLDKLDELIADYGLASVADLYDLVGEESSYTDNKYGWTDLRTAHPERVRDGYILVLPKAKALN